jgi:hypothetical protein
LTDSSAEFERIGLIAKPEPTVSWLATHAGPAFATPDTTDGVFEVFISGRDRSNRSTIGRAILDLRDDKPTAVLDPEPVLSPGGRGAFDENGVSYPWIVTTSSERRMYYVGWMPTVLTPFQNHIGLAIASPGSHRFERFSRAPILSRTDADHLSMGSCCVHPPAPERNKGWQLWYTAFSEWSGEAPLHRYRIKYATSDDGVNWHRDDHVAIDFQGAAEYAVCRPSVLANPGGYNMWFCSRGDRYRIRSARSPDGRTWTRDSQPALALGPDGQFDSDEQSYPHVFTWRGNRYMLYCGNGYGEAGLGLARSRATRPRL